MEELIESRDYEKAELERNKVNLQQRILDLEEQREKNVNIKLDLNQQLVDVSRKSYLNHFHFYKHLIFVKHYF